MHLPRDNELNMMFNRWVASIGIQYKFTHICDG